MPVDAGAGIPSAVRLEGVIDLDGDNIVAVDFEVRRQIVGEGYIAIGAQPQPGTVDPDFAVLIDTVTFQSDDFATMVGGDVEALSVPTDAGR